ncbi:MAG: phospholipase D family protein [Betaproteobacteria bacterium]|nr:MAG: phospholipase D family protein [Betaproteobacteria bacterium]
MRRALLGLALLYACTAGAQIPVWAPGSFPVSQAPPALPAQGTVQVAFTPWDNAEGLIADGIRRAKHQILVQAFSFTSRTLANALMAAKKRGVDVQVMADREQTFSGEASRIPELVQAGIPVMLELRYQSAHNKVMVIDAGTADAAVITGSYNWTYAAQYKNAENVLILRHNPDIANAYAANWRRHFAEALPYAAQ